MPSKNKRAASRQAKLSQRRRRRGGGRRQRTSERPTAEATVTSSAANRRRGAATAVATQNQTPTVAVPSAPASERPPRSVAAAPRARTRAAQSRAATYEPLPMYAYLGSELKRIGAIAAVMALALAALTVVLGQA